MDTVGRRGLLICPDWRWWALGGIVALVDAVWLLLSDHTLDLLARPLWIVIAAVAVAWYGAGYFIRLAEGPRRFALGLVFIWLGSRAVAILGQLVMTLPFPMTDSLLAGWDGALGFDWPAYLSWVVARPWLARALEWVYYACMPASLLAFVALHLAGRPGRAEEYLALSLVVGLIATIIGAAFPTIGAASQFPAAKEMMAAFPPHTGAQWVARLTELRSGGPVVISDTIGLVSLPSYHVALTVIIAWCFRGFRLLFPAWVLFALGTSASAPIIGGHYFVDLIAGAVLVIIVISAMGWKPLRAPIPAG